MKVYVVDEVDFGIAGVFSCRENAENFISMQKDGVDGEFGIKTSIIEFHLDNIEKEEG